MKKTPSKVAHNRPRPFFFSTGLAAQTAQKQKSRTTKSPLMQDWVFRLGSQQCIALQCLYIVKCATHCCEINDLIGHKTCSRTMMHMQLLTYFCINCKKQQKQKVLSKFGVNKN